MNQNMKPLTDQEIEEMTWRPTQSEMVEMILEKGKLERQHRIKAAEARGRARGRAEGRAEGAAQVKRKAATSLLSQGLSHDAVADATGLSHSEITEIAAGLEGGANHGQNACVLEA